MMGDYPFTPAPRNKHLTGLARRNAIANDQCPECGGDLDTGWECNDCGFDARDEALAIPGMNSSGPSTPTEVN